MKQAVNNRKIKYVWHFTRLCNLDSILSNGLLSRTKLDKHGRAYSFNDQHRLDLRKDAICFTIGHPNYKMFYSLRMQHPNEEWVVVACKPNMLWEKDCAFCHENAASNNVTIIPIAQRKGVNAFNRMFAEIDGKPARKELELPDDCPTNPQAEILVLDDVEPEYIIGAICKTKAREENLKSAYPNFQFLYHKALFAPRKDYSHWK